MAKYFKPFIKQGSELIPIKTPLSNEDKSKLDNAFSKNGGTISGPVYIGNSDNPITSEQGFAQLIYTKSAKGIFIRRTDTGTNTIIGSNKNGYVHIERQASNEPNVALVLEPTGVYERIGNDTEQNIKKLATIEVLESAVSEINNKINNFNDSVEGLHNQYQDVYETTTSLMNTKVNKSGDTLTGPLTINSTSGEAFRARRSGKGVTKRLYSGVKTDVDGYPIGHIQVTTESASGAAIGETTVGLLLRQDGLHENKGGITNKLAIEPTVHQVSDAIAYDIAWNSVGLFWDTAITPGLYSYTLSVQIVPQSRTDIRCANQYCSGTIRFVRNADNQLEPTDEKTTGFYIVTGSDGKILAQNIVGSIFSSYNEYYMCIFNIGDTLDNPGNEERPYANMILTRIAN